MMICFLQMKKESLVFAEIKMNREEMLLKMLARADEEIKQLQYKTEFLTKELTQLRERLNYMDHQVYGGSTK